MISVKQVSDSAVQSWRTTTIGVITWLGLVGPQITALLDGSAETITDWNVIALATGVLIQGIFARDNVVTSRKAGAE